MTDTTREGAQVVLGLTGKEACPVKVLFPYVYGSQRCTTRPLFITADNHSFRIGAATTGEAAGFSETQIKTLGHWRSNAYQRYIRPSPSQLAMLSKKLA